MDHLFWLSDEQLVILVPFKPKNQPETRRVDDRREISGIVYVIKTGGAGETVLKHSAARDDLQPHQQMIWSATQAALAD